MSFETRFTSDEQALLMGLPNLVASAMTFAAGSGLGTVKEMVASSRAFLKGREIPDNEIIAGIMPGMQSMDEAMHDSKQMREILTGRLKQQQVTSTEQLRDIALADAAAAAKLLQTKGQPGEAEQYKNWVLDIAEDVAKSAKEGGFLGFGGTQVSANESDMFIKLAAALNVTRSMS